MMAWPHIQTPGENESLKYSCDSFAGGMRDSLKRGDRLNVWMNGRHVGVSRRSRMASASNMIRMRRESASACRKTAAGERTLRKISCSTCFLNPVRQNMP